MLAALAQDQKEANAMISNLTNNTNNTKIVAVDTNRGETIASSTSGDSLRYMDGE